MSILSLYLIFSPVVTLLQWIPLVGYFLGMMAALAALAIALVAGLALSCVVMTLAWLCFRPLLSLSLLLVTGVAAYGALYWDGTVPEFL